MDETCDDELGCVKPQIYLSEGQNKEEVLKILKEEITNQPCIRAKLLFDSAEPVDNTFDLRDVARDVAMTKQDYYHEDINCLVINGANTSIKKELLVEVYNSLLELTGQSPLPQGEGFVST